MEWLREGKLPKAAARNGEFYDNTTIGFHRHLYRADSVRDRKNSPGEGRGHLCVQIGPLLGFDEDSGCVLRISGDGKRASMLSRGNSLELLDLDAAERHGRSLPDETLRGMAMDPSGRWIATHSEFDRVTLWHGDGRHYTLDLGERVSRLAFDGGSARAALPTVSDLGGLKAGAASQRNR